MVKRISTAILVLSALFCLWLFCFKKPTSAPTDIASRDDVSYPDPIVNASAGEMLASLSDGQALSEPATTEEAPHHQSGNHGFNEDTSFRSAQTGKRSATALDSLKIVRTVAEEWPNGLPARDGWHPRVRIVEVDFKARQLRLEENVEIQMSEGKVTVVQSFIERAMDASHVLVSRRHAEELVAMGFELGDNERGGYIRLLVAQSTDTRSIPLLLNQLQDAGISRVEPDAVIERAAFAADPLVGSGAAWHLENLGLLRNHTVGSDIGALQAWQVRTDASSVLIALIDSGIDESASEILPSLFYHPGEMLGDGIDSDGNGWIDDVRGYNFVSNNAVITDVSRHGTACALLIGAAGNNGVGSSGVAWQAAILDCKVLDDSGIGLLSDAVDAVHYARHSQVDVINLSWSYQGNAAVLTEALALCDAQGILIVCAAGNGGADAPVPAPASIDLPHLVSVAASTPDDTLALFSAVDPDVIDLAAPGVDLPIQSGINQGGIGQDVRYETGTSFSAAIVSGALALARAEFPDESSLATIQRMQDTVRPIPGGSTRLAYGGVLDLGAMLSSTERIIAHGLFADRRIIGDPTGQWTGRNSGTHSEALDQTLGLPSAPQRSVWFEWTAAYDGRLRIAAEGPASSGVVLTVFSMIDGRPGVKLGRSSSPSGLELTVAAGETLIWMLDSSSPLERDLRLFWHLPPPNDNWTNASPIPQGVTRIAGNSAGATLEPFETAALDGVFIDAPGSLWWSWRATTEQFVMFEATPGHFVMLLPVGADGLPVFDEENFMLALLGQRFPVVPNQTYAVMIIPITSAARGPFDIFLRTADDFFLLKQPRSVAAIPGETVEIGFDFRSNALFMIQWFKDGEAISFSTGNSLRFSPLTASHFGTYHAEIRFGAEVLTTRAAVVSPRNDPPRLLSQIARRSIMVGQSAQFSATFNSASPVTYQWRKNGNLIPGASAASYHVVNAAFTDAGTYSLTASNASGSTTASMQLDVLATPWDGWVERTPGAQGGGSIIKVDMAGNKAAVFTAMECRISNDGGNSWNVIRAPAGLEISEGGLQADGSLLVSGNAFGGLSQNVWKHNAAGGWSAIQPVIQLSEQQPAVPVRYVTNLCSFDGVWWAQVTANSADYFARSVDGIQWSLPQIAALPDFQNKVTGMFRFEDALAIYYWKNHSIQGVYLIKPGGVGQVLGFSNDVRHMMRIGGVNYAIQGLPRVLHRADDSGAPSVPVTQVDGSRYLLAWNADGQVSDGVLHALEADTSYTGSTGGSLITGLHERGYRRQLMRFRTYAKQGSTWLVGYADGTVWMGTDLTLLPKYEVPSQLMNPALSTYRDEFVFGGFHSSDGANWQRLPHLSLIPSQVMPISQLGGHFYFSYATPGIQSVATRSFSLSFWSHYQTATVFNTSSRKWAAGEHETLSWQASSGLDASRIRLNGGEIQEEPVVLGTNQTGVESASFMNGRWFLKSLATSAIQAKWLTSLDGITWQETGLPLDCVIGTNGSSWVAVRNTGGGFVSANGVSWTPVVFTGLPVGQTPSAIVPYRGYHVAKFGAALFASQNGIVWAAGAPPLPVTEISANRHTMLVRSGARLLQPGGEDESGPWIALPREMEQVSVYHREGFVYRLQAGDEDGDLVGVDCFVNGRLLESKTSEPYHFRVTSPVSGMHAVEFMARDSKGRISRVTASLELITTGVTPAQSVIIDADLTKAFLFHGQYYRYAKIGMNPGMLFIWLGGHHWRPISPAYYNLNGAVANSRAIVAWMANGMLVSVDGQSWRHYGGIVPDSVVVRNNIFHAQQFSGGWTSEDGESWQRSTTSTAAHWANANFGWNDGTVTRDGGRTWIPIDLPYLAQNRVIAINDLLLIHVTQLGGNAVYRLRPDSYVAERIEGSTANPGDIRLVEIAGVVFLWRAGHFLRTTTDGLHFRDLPQPGNQFSYTLHQQGQSWVAVSSDSIYRTFDLQSWELLRQLPVFNPQFGYQPSITVTVDGLDKLVIRHDLMPTVDLILREGGQVEEVPRFNSGVAISQIPSGGNGVKFKGRWISASGWWFSKPERGGQWERAALQPSENFVQPISHSWPINGLDQYKPSHGSLIAANQDRFLSFRPDLFNPSLNYIIVSDDGKSFTIHHWTGPVELWRLTDVAASNHQFMALTNQNGMLVSSNGLTWTMGVLPPGLNAKALMWFGGKWHVAGLANVTNPQGATVQQAQVWSSLDGANWSLRGTMERPPTMKGSMIRESFIGQGIARLFVDDFGWMRSGNGETWSPDHVLNASHSPVSGVTADALLVSQFNAFRVVDPESGDVIQNINLGAASTVWIGDWPFISSLGRLDPWTLVDPRIEHVDAEKGVRGVGDLVSVTVRKADLPDQGASLKFMLSADFYLGNEDDVVLGVARWSDGEMVDGDTRRFSLPLPPATDPGHFHVGAVLELLDEDADATYQNNQMLSLSRVVEVPGFRLRIETVGEGEVQSQDPRILYPLGSEVQLNAVAAQGFTFEGWNGAVISAQSSIKVRMDDDQELTVVFNTGISVRVRTVGRGGVTGAPASRIVQPGTMIHLSQQAAAGWNFAGWMMDGELTSTADFTHQPLADTVVEAVFHPDFESLRASAFAEMPETIDRSWHADPDGDGLSNWQEILLGFDPTTPDGIYSRLEKVGESFRFVFTRPQGPIGRPWVKPEFSDGMIQWRDADGLRLIERVLSTRDGIETVEVVLPFVQGTKGFFRLRMPDSSLLDE